MEKTLCVSRTQQATITHLSSIVSHQISITLTQQAVDAKTNEILQTYDVSGQIVTTDFTLLNDYLNCRSLAQVDEYQGQRINGRIGEVTDHKQYGITRLPSEKANAQNLFCLRRGHWTIENLSHRTRDVTFKEDASQVGCGNIPQVMAALRNTVIILLHISGHTKIEKAQNFFAARAWQALEILQKPKFDN